MALTACSGRLDLGHDLANPKAAPGDASGATCDGDPCYRGPVIALATSMGSAKSLVLDDDNVYWAAPAARMLMITPRDGSATVGVATAAGGPLRLAADATQVYFSGADGGYVAALSKSTRGIRALVSNQPSPHSLAVAREGIYFSDATAGTVKRAGLAATSSDEVSLDQAIETLADGISAGGELAVDAEWVYYSDSGRGEINAFERRSGELARLSDGLAHPGALLPRGDWLYFLELGTPEAGYDDGRLLRMPRGGGEVEELLRALDAPTGLAADSTSVYVSTRGNEGNGFRGRIIRRADDGEVATLATDQAEAISIAVDHRALFWTVDSENSLHSLER